MFTYKISDDITQKVNAISNEDKKKKSVNDLLNEISNINNKFTNTNKIDLPEEIKLDKLDKINKNDNEIKTSSENALADFKDASIEKINNEISAKENELNANKNNLKQQNEEDKTKLQSYYDNAKQNASDQALSRGLGRSSIVINQLGAFDQNQINDYKALDKELSENVSKINSDISLLTSQKEKALNDFNIEYAVKIQEKIAELNNELFKKNEEITKYNNEISLKEAEFNKELSELKNKLKNDNFDNDIDIAKIYGEYGQNVINRIKQDEIYNTTKNALGALSREEAIEMLNNPELKSALGEDNYKKLFAELSK